MKFLLSEAKVWPKIKGIYALLDGDGRTLVGQTTRSMKSRWNNHVSLLRRNKHENTILQNKYNKYGKNYFYFIILEESNIENLDQKERFWITKLNSMYNQYGYNLREGGYSVKMSELTKNKIRQASKGICRPHMPKKYKFIDPNNEIIDILNLKKFSKNNNLNYRKMLAVHRQERNHHKGWRLVLFKKCNSN